MFLVAENRNKLLVKPEVFKRVDHKYFTEKKLIEYKGDKWVVVPFDERTNSILTRHNIKDVPAPIEYYYNWPGRWKPFKHQVATAKFLTTYHRCFVFNEMGTGKTMAALWAADYLMSQNHIKSTLIISPLSTIQSVWGDALWESFHHRKYEVIYGSKQKRIEALKRKADFYVINHDGIKIPEIAKILEQRKDINHVILDESAVFRNQKTGRYKAMWNIAGPNSGRSLWSLTGAPMPKEPTDIWAQARLINPELVPKFFNRFKHELMHQVSPFKWVPKKGWEEKCYSMVKPSIRFTTEQCLDLPPITYIEHQTAMSPKQAKIHDAILNKYKAEVLEGKIVAANEGVKLNKLIQITSGACYTSDHNVVELDPKDKLKVLEETVYEANCKCIVFTPFTHSIDVIYKHLKSKFRVEKISGATSLNKRSEYFREFQQGDLEVLVAHPGCMAHGVTLTASSTIVWFAPIDNYEIYEQANARIRRAGQVQHQTIVHLQCSKEEQRVYTRLKNKEKTQGLLLDLLESS